ncbi:MAG: amino acid adenylation domain-containing protein, partial [Acidobacteria bacterium]|nr:amino acid adenylation domain-containing protein [Acidobacteriota bacterium]
RATSLHITYLQLNEQSNGLAYVLQTKGVQPDTIAGIMVERSYEMIVGILGILKSGGAYLPIAPEYPQERIEYMLKDSGANLLITANNIEGEKVRRYEGEQIHIEHILHHPEHLSLHHTSLITHHSNYLAYIIYTSGTTGKPKGVMIEHYNVVRLLFNNRFQFDFNDRDVWSLFHSYSFDFSVWEIYGALLYGGQLIIISRENTINPPQFLKTIKKFQVTILNQTPSAFYNLINEELSKENKDLKLRYVIFGGDALRPSKLKEWHERYPLTRLVNMFGITETTVHVTYKEIKEEEIRAENSNIGGPIPTLTVYIMNQFQRLMPLGAVGELCVGGAGVARGYLNRPELTAEKFVENPYKPGELFYKSGDLARIIRNGDMEYLGRKDHQVKIRGYRIELEEIEKQLLKHPSIGDCIVIDRLDTSGNKILCAYYICKTAGHDINEEELKVYLSKEQPEYMIPAHFISIEKIPLTTNGKPDRKALPEPGLHINDGREYIPPENTTQAKLVEIWSQVLGVEKKLIGITANFFQLGGHSLNAAIVISKIHKDLNVKIPLAEIFKGPTIQELSQKIKKLKTEIYADFEPVEKKEYYRLSSAQKRLYFLQQKDSDSIGYNILTSVVLEGSIDIPLLEDTFRKLIKRHESLRTSFDVVNDEIVQRISENVEFKIEYYDNENISVHDNFVRAFDLSKAPLMRIGLFRLEAQAHLLLTDLHHIISDGVSHAILKEDFEILYNGDSLPALQLHYKDYSEWQNDEKQKQIVSKQKTFWLNNLSGNISILQLPIDYPRPIIQNFEGDSITFKLGNVEVERLNKLCKDHEVTLYMVLLAIFNILMAKLSNHDEILLGTPVAGRRHVDLERIIGMFVNTLALKNYPNAEKTFTDFLKEVKENTIQAFENQDFQFEELVELLAVKRDNSRNPIFDVAFVLQNINTQMKGTPGKVISNISMRMQPHLHTKSIAKFDLTLTALEITGGINFSLTYCIRLFKKETIQRMIDYFQKIIQDVLKTPNILLAKIEILSEKEKKRLLYDFNDTAAKYPREKTIHQLFEEQVERTPDHIAVVEETPNGSLGTYNYLSYRELNKWADNVAQSLIENGVKPDTIVGIMIDRIPGMIAGIFGILKSKGVYLPIDPDYPQERIDFILKDSAAKIIVVGNRQVYSQKSNLQVSILNCELMRTPRMPFYHSSFISNSSHLVYIIYTSGTTGKPKGVLIEGKNVVRLMFNDRFQFNFSDRDVWSFFHSYNFDFSVWEMYGALLYGGKLLIIPKITTRDTAKFLKFLKKNQVTILNQTPSAFCNLSALELNSPGKELNIKYIIFGGEALVPSHLKEWKSK